MSEESQPKDSLGQAILKTIAFFDLFDYPLTTYEIYKNLDRRATSAEIIEVLDQEIKQESGFIQTKNGFYFLAGRETIVATRSRRHNYSVRKMKIARRFARLFGLCPFVKAVALANSLGQHNLRDASDIDFFIIAAPRRLWLSRLYCAGLAKILNRRPRAANKKDKLCLSFYISADRLNLDDLKLPDGDPYFDHWRRQLVLLYNKGKIYEKFLAANGLGGDLIDQPVNVQPTAEDSDQKPTKNNFLLDGLEKIANKLQLIIMPSVLRTAINNSDGVVVNDHALKFYVRDRRREFREKYGHQINEILSARD